MTTAAEEDDVRQIVETVCDLLMQYELVSKVDSTGDLQAILRQNLMDACNWVRSPFSASASRA